MAASSCPMQCGIVVLICLTNACTVVVEESYYLHKTALGDLDEGRCRRIVLKRIGGSLPMNGEKCRYCSPPNEQLNVSIYQLHTYQSPPP